MNNEQDLRRVSEAYREIATETSPTDTDDRIRAMARQEARTRYGVARAWIRPVAWAATVGLSFAFLLEMTYFSDDPLPVDAAMPASEDGDTSDVAEPATTTPAFKRAPAPVATAPEIATVEQQEIREAGERSDRAASGFAEPLPAADARGERVSPRKAARSDGCDAVARQHADTWYRCILALREQGLVEAASAEFEALREAFPDFREPLSE